jgi:hypothetical protein
VAWKSPLFRGTTNNMKALTLLHLILLLRGAEATSPMVRIRLYDDANLGAESRKSFRTEAAGILLKSGVSSVWLWCPPSPEAPVECTQDVTGLELVLRILPRGMIGHDLALGSSVADRDGGTYGLIYYPTVVRTARINSVPIPRLAAWAGVHEIGHLLLGARAHWPSGIMNGRWDQNRVDEIVKAGPFFNDAQSKQLRNSLMARARRGDGNGQR